MCKKIILFFQSWFVDTFMFSATNYFKISNSVIALISVQVMNNFYFFKWSSKKFRHYKTVLRNVSFEKIICVFMPGFINANVAACGGVSASFPGRTLFSYKRSLKMCVTSHRAKEMFRFFKLFHLAINKFSTNITRYIFSASRKKLPIVAPNKLLWASINIFWINFCFTATGA